MLCGPGVIIADFRQAGMLALTKERFKKITKREENKIKIWITCLV